MLSSKFPTRQDGQHLPRQDKSPQSIHQEAGKRKTAARLKFFLSWAAAFEAVSYQVVVK